MEHSPVPTESNTIPSSTSVQPLDDKTFDRHLRSATVPVLVEFTAPWCAPCRALEPILHELARESAGRWSIAKIDGDQHPELATRFGIRGFPTLLLFAGGREVARQLGLTSKKKLLELLGG